MSTAALRPYYLKSNNGKLLVDVSTRKPMIVNVPSGGIIWNVYSARELPATAEEMDICLIPKKATAPLINTENLKVVQLMDNLVVDDGNIYPEDMICIFAQYGGEEGNNKLDFDIGFQTLRVKQYPIAASVVNVGETQQKCEVYFYHAGEWVNAKYIEIPSKFGETFSLEDWIGTDYFVVDLCDVLGMTEETGNDSTETTVTSENITLDGWLGTLSAYTVIDICQDFGMSEEAFYSLGTTGEDIPIT